MPLDEGVLYHAGVEILESLADTATAAGIHEYTPEEVEGALYRALDVYREARGSSVDQAAHEEDLAELIEADQQGQLGAVLPGVEGA
jgi:hypothetical protein